MQLIIQYQVSLHKKYWYSCCSREKNHIIVKHLIGDKISWKKKVVAIVACFKKKLIAENHFLASVCKVVFQFIIIIIYYNQS